MKSADTPQPPRRWPIVLFAAVGLAALFALTVGIVVVALSPDSGEADRTSFALCGHDFDVRDGYIGTYRERAEGQDRYRAFYVRPTQTSTADDLADIITSAEVLSGGSLGEGDLQGAIDESLAGDGAVVPLVENTADGCRFSTVITEARMNRAGWVYWVLYVYAGPA